MRYLRHASPDRKRSAFLDSIRRHSLVPFSNENLTQLAQRPRWGAAVARGGAGWHAAVRGQRLHRDPARNGFSFICSEFPFSMAREQPAAWVRAACCKLESTDEFEAEAGKQERDSTREWRQTSGRHWPREGRRQSRSPSLKPEVASEVKLIHRTSIHSLSRA